LAHVTTLEHVKTLVADVCAIDASAIKDDGKLLELGIDSVRAMDLLVAIEHAFSIEVPDRDAAKLVSLGDVVAYIDKKRA
jgi:acyl carrier protein